MQMIPRPPSRSGAMRVSSLSRFDRQARQYAYPYHWIPRGGDAWQLGQDLGWGHEYLGVLGVVKDEVLSTGSHRILDFGCGDGRLGVELAEAGRWVLGVDLSERAIAFAQAFAVGLDRCIFRVENIQKVPERDFDLAIAMEVLEHLPEESIHDVLQALWERLRPGGTLVVSVPTTNTPVSPKHYRHYTRSLLDAQLSNFFACCSVRYVHRTGWKEALLRRIWTNRVVTLRSYGIARTLTGCYRKWVMDAAEHDGAHLVAVYEKKDCGADGRFLE